MAEVLRCLRKCHSWRAKFCVKGAKARRIALAAPEVLWNFASVWAIIACHLWGRSWVSTWIAKPKAHAEDAARLVKLAVKS